jgi:hypothetical protein
MVVSDDETPPGETWNFLVPDTRVRPIMNVSRHGAPFNHRHALTAGRGETYKACEGRLI